MSWLSEPYSSEDSASHYGRDDLLHDMKSARIQFGTSAEKWVHSLQRNGPEWPLFSVFVYTKLSLVTD